MLTRMWSNGNSHSLLLEMQNGTATLGNSLAVSYKAKHTLTMLLLLLSRFSRVRLLATPWTAAYQAPPSVGFSRQEYWSGVPLPSPTLTIQTSNCMLLYLPKRVENLFPHKHALVCLYQPYL